MKLTVQIGGQKHIHVMTEQGITIGRGKETTIPIFKDAVSRKHCRFFARGGNVLVEDIGSSNGTALNGQFIKEPTPVNVGDKVFLGTTIVHVVAIEKEDETVEYFDRMVGAIRQQREDHKKEQVVSRDRLEEEWVKLMKQLQALKDRVGSHRRVKFFTISPDKKEVTISLHQEGTIPAKYLLLARKHPEGKFPALDALWLIETGETDRHLSSANEVMTQVVRSLAHLFA